MRAIVVQEAGDASVLRCMEVADPVPEPGEVLLRVAAAGVCSHDIAIQRGILRRGVTMPLIPGHEVAGIVEALGPGVGNLRVGDRVAGTQRRRICGVCDLCRTGREAQCERRVFLGHGMESGGCYAERVCIGGENLALVPEGVSLSDAAIAACAIGTCLNAVRDVARVTIGDTVLVTGAGGGLGVHAVQMARLAGARVLALTTTPRKVPALEVAGADHVILAGRGEDYSPKIKAVTGGRGADVAIDNVGSATFHETRRSLAAGGRWVFVGELAGGFVQVNPAQLFLQGLTVLSVRSATRAHLQETLALLASGRIRAVVSETLPLADAASAHRRVEAGEVVGRLVLHPHHREGTPT